MTDLQSTLLRGLDQALPQMEAARRDINVPSRGWLRSVRGALGATQTSVAKKLGVTRQSYDDLERAEERGAITVGKLQQAAAALDCEMVYFIAPRKQGASSFTALARIRDPHLRATEHSMALENQAVGDMALPPKSAAIKSDA
jgi:predicted DNA-binding mobile mystery protein A